MGTELGAYGLRTRVLQAMWAEELTNTTFYAKATLVHKPWLWWTVRFFSSS